MNNTNLKLAPEVGTLISPLDITYDVGNEIAWYRMNAHPRPCFTSDLIDEILLGFDAIMNDDVKGIKYIAVGSNVPDVFNLGGDLNLFKTLVQEKNYESILKYALRSIEPLYLFHVGLNKNITTISLVQGDALGAGFETALSGDILIAEKGGKMGFPETLFNMFPGMGAFSFLSRKVGSIQAEKMILGGKLYSVEELYDMGLVDILVEKGEGEQAVYTYMKKEKRARNGYRAFRQAKRHCNPVTFEELKAIASVWADAIMNLTDKDLRMIDRLVKRQSAKTNS